MSTESNIKNNYFDGLPVRTRHKILFVIIAMFYFFEQLDNMLLGFVAPAVIKTFQIGIKEFAPVQSLYFIGMMLGALTGGMISDRIGRRKTLIGALILTSASCIITGFTNNILMFTIFRTTTGFGVFCTTIVAITYVAEVSPGDQRGKWEGICATFAFLAAPVIGFVAAKVLPLAPEAWRWIFGCGFLGIIPLLLSFKYLNETPRWLVSKGRIAEAEAVVKEISGVAVDLSEAAKSEKGGRINVLESLVELVKGKYLARTIICLVIGFAQQAPSFVFIAWNNTLLQLNGIPQAQALMITTIGTLGQPVGAFLSAYVGPLGGRKIPIGVSLALCSAILLVYINIGSVIMLATFLFLFQLTSICAAYCIYPYQAESFPTSVRNTATGTINATARLGTAGTQQVVPMIFNSGGFPALGMVLASMGFAGAIAALVFGWKTGKKPLEEVC